MMSGKSQYILFVPKFVSCFPFWSPQFSLKLTSQWPFDTFSQKNIPGNISCLITNSLASGSVGAPTMSQTNKKRQSYRSLGEKLNVVGSKTSSPSLESLERNACVNDLQEACQTFTLEKQFFIQKERRSWKIFLREMENWCTSTPFSFHGQWPLLGMFSKYSQELCWYFSVW